MKIKIILLALIALTFSCSTDDIDPSADELLTPRALIVLKTKCGADYQTFSFCISEEEYGRTVESLQFGNTCSYVSVTDTDGNLQEGYFAGGGLGTCNQ